jgi:DNA-binding GntR family transcriptional regulator
MKTITTVGNSTYQKIKHDIIFGDLEPASKLKLDSLKTKYSTSMSTLRESLNRLASEEFVIAEEQRGFFVAPVSREDLTEIADLRVMLECHALKLSIERGDTDWEGNLVAAHHKLSLMEKQMKIGNESIIEDWKRYDWEFHLAMIAACEIKNLLSLHSIIYQKYLRYQMRVLTYRGEQAVEEHQEMFESAIKRDTKVAVKSLKEHIENGLRHTLDAFED